MNIHPLNKIKLVGVIASFAVLVFVLGTRDAQYVSAGPNHNLHGYVFSDAPTNSDQCLGTGTPLNPQECAGLNNATPGTTAGLFGRGLGYISMNRDDVGGGSPDYGVNLSQNGILEGYGWSESGYPVWFNPSGAYPNGSGTIPGPARIPASCVTGTTPCAVTGWIRFMNINPAESGGWDGWVSMSGNIQNQFGNFGTYGVTYDPVAKKFSGDAWGDSVTGWLNFNKVTADTHTNQIPVCTDPLANNDVPTPLGVGQVDDPSVCQYAIDFCLTHPDLCEPLDPLCKLHPELCIYVNHICTNSAASNYTPPPYTSTQVPDNAVCLFAGCTNPGAINYDPTATIDDGTCSFTPCTDPLLCPKTPIKPIYKEN